jgi:transcriptional regulator with XRE-family HTH domain
MPQLFGTKLRHLRTQQGVTQVELARWLSLTTHTHITHLEAGRNTPSIELVVRIARYFQVTTDYLLRDAVAVEAPTHFGDVGALEQPPQYRAFGTKLCYLRKQRNLTQRDVAHQIGLSAQAHISFLETNRKEPSIDLLLKIADFFQVTTDYLLNDAIPVERVEKPEP